MCIRDRNGKIAYCLESHRSSPPSGDYVAQVLDSNKNLQKVLYYGYGGAGDITEMCIRDSQRTGKEKYRTVGNGDADRACLTWKTQQHACGSGVFD